MDAHCIDATPTELLFPVSEVPTRRVPRRGARGGAELVTAHHDEPVDVQLRDLSPFGVGVETALDLSPGDEVVVCFSPPGRRELMVFGEIRRRRLGASPDEGGLGIEFVDITYDEMVLVHKALTPQRS